MLHATVVFVNGSIVCGYMLTNQNFVCSMQMTTAVLKVKTLFIGYKDIINVIELIIIIIIIELSNDQN